jgi:hypothetical protein
MRSNLTWIAETLEEEGCFDMHAQLPYPRIRLKLTNKVKIQWFAQVTGAHMYGPHIDKRRPNARPCWTAELWGESAAGWMLILRPQMSKSRQQEITECLVAGGYL